MKLFLLGLLMTLPMAETGFARESEAFDAQSEASVRLDESFFENAATKSGGCTGSQGCKHKLEMKRFFTQGTRLIYELRWSKKVKNPGKPTKNVTCEKLTDDDPTSCYYAEKHQATCTVNKVTRSGTPGKSDEVQRAWITCDDAGIHKEDQRTAASYWLKGCWELSTKGLIQHRGGNCDNTKDGVRRAFNPYVEGRYQDGKKMDGCQNMYIEQIIQTEKDSCMITTRTCNGSSYPNYSWTYCMDFQERMQEITYQEFDKYGDDMTFTVEVTFKRYGAYKPANQ